MDRNRAYFYYTAGNLWDTDRFWKIALSMKLAHYQSEAAHILFLSAVYILISNIAVYIYFSLTWYTATATATGSDICNKKCMYVEFNLILSLWICMQFGNKLILKLKLLSFYPGGGGGLKLSLLSLCGQWFPRCGLIYNTDLFGHEICLLAKIATNCRYTLFLPSGVEIKLILSLQAMVIMVPQFLSYRTLWDYAPNDIKLTLNTTR